jgi:hypothetical protein
MMKLRIAFAFIAFMGFLGTSAFAASSEESSLGRYVYQSKEMTIKLRIDVDGVKELTINDTSYPGLYPTTYLGVVSGIGVYIIVVTDEKGRLIHEIELIDRFDESGQLIAVAGFYVEKTSVSSGKESKDSTKVLVFQPKFTRIPIG